MKITVKKRRRNFNKTTDILKQNNMERLLKYLKENPHEAKRFNQCFNCFHKNRAKRIVRKMKMECAKNVFLLATKLNILPTDPRPKFSRDVCWRRRN